MGNNAITAMLILAGAIVLVGVALMRFISLHEKLSSRVRRRFAEFQAKVSFFENRLRLVQDCALDYMNSMTPEGARAMYQLQQLVATQAKLLEELDEMIKSDESAALVQADRVLFEMLAGADGAVQSNGAESPGSSLDGWEIKFEEMLQLVGRDVNDASRMAKELGVPKRRDRKPTSMNLKDAGIIEAEIDELQNRSEEHQRTVEREEQELSLDKLLERGSS
jgi:hypothetical protein